jgi:two-component system nitrate/nitrite response regulator NarL
MRSAGTQSHGCAKANVRNGTDAASESTKVFIVSNVRLYRDGMSVMLARTPRISVAGAAAWEGAEALHPDLYPDIVLLDATVPDLSSVARCIIRSMPDSKIVAFALGHLETEALICAEAGISAFVGQDASARELIIAIDQARRGEFAISARFTSILLERVAELSRRSIPATPLAKALTHREQQILPLIERGMSNKEIARVLSIEAATIKNHIHNILEKMQLRRRGEIAARVRAG